MPLAPLRQRLGALQLVGCCAYKLVNFQETELKSHGNITSRQASDRVLNQNQSFSLVTTVMTGNGLTENVKDVGSKL